MDKNIMIQSLLGLKNALNVIEVKGEINLDLLFGSIKAVNNLLNEITKPTEAKVE